MLFLLIIFVCSCFVGASAHDHYEPFAMDPADLTAVLEQTFAKDVPSLRTVPADITFGCVDIKYNRGSFKIVECGDANYMSFRTGDVLMNGKPYKLVAPYWGIFWHYLRSFGLPVWQVGDAGPANAVAGATLRAVGGRYAHTWYTLMQDPLFKKAAQQAKGQSSSIQDYAGIIVFRAPREIERDGGKKNRELNYPTFRSLHPNFIYVNAATRDFLKRKDATYKVFTDAGLHNFIPHAKLYPTVYSNSLASRILEEFPDQKLVIKPMYSSLSAGVNVVDRRSLNKLLITILRDKKLIIPGSHRSLDYWRRTSPPSFIASEHVASQTLYKDGSPYDPTLRVMFTMHHNEGRVTINVLGAFWKIPVKPLDDKNANLTEKHVTIAHAGAYYSGILMEKGDSDTLKQSLAPVLARAYEEMLLQAYAVKGSGCASQSNALPSFEDNGNKGTQGSA